MNSGEKLFGRLLNRQSPPPQVAPDTLSVPSVGLQVHLDGEGRVLHLTGPLRHTLAPQPLSTQAAPLLDYLMPHSSLVIEGIPADWQGQILDLDFHSVSGHPLHLRGWVQPLGNGWLLQLMDIADLLLERQQSRQREACHLLAEQISKQLRSCSLGRLPMLVSEQLQVIAQRWQIPCLALALLDEQEGADALMVKPASDVNAR